MCIWISVSESVAATIYTKGHKWNRNEPLDFNRGIASWWWWWWCAVGPLVLACCGISPLEILFGCTREQESTFSIDVFLSRLFFCFVFAYFFFYLLLSYILSSLSRVVCPSHNPKSLSRKAEPSIVHHDIPPRLLRNSQSCDTHRSAPPPSPFQVFEFIQKKTMSTSRLIYHLV